MAECNGVCIIEKRLYHKGCPLHKDQVATNDKTFLDSIREIEGRRASNGVRGPKVQLRGD